VQTAELTVSPWTCKTFFNRPSAGFAAGKGLLWEMNPIDTTLV
jgi:hypothetical protein